MQKQTRRLLFYSLAAVFIIVVPFLLAHSLGYTFDFYKRSVEKTGGIFIKSKLPRLSIFVNGALAKETSLLGGGAILTGITPGTHLLRIEKAEYRPWSKTVNVLPEIVTELRNIILVPEKTVYAAPTLTESSLFAPATSKAAGFLLDKKNNLLQKGATTTEILAQNVNSFAVLGDAIFFVDKNGFLARLDLASKTVKTIGRPGFYLSEKSVKFIKSPRGEMAILDPSGGVFISDGSETLAPLGGGATEIYFDGKGEKLLLHKDQSIEVMWLADSPRQPFEKRGTKVTVLQISSPILDSRWFYGDNAHIVIRTAEGIFITELDGRGGRYTADLVSDKTDELLTFPEIPSAIFFRKGKTWFKLEI